jgi:UDP-N-acetylmuramyl pentapeptide synthase
MVSGSNGKTTTTKMVVQLLESQGLKVFTNRTGSNFVRGVVAALLGEVDMRGKLDADIAVLDYTRQRYPEQEIHLSVQASATNSAAVRFYKENFNVQRYICFPRQLSDLVHRWKYSHLAACVLWRKAAATYLHT